jgi:hypothetical protein
VLEGYEEHHVADVLLDELLDVPPDTDLWKAKVKVLKENVEHHMDEEEDELFKGARAVLDREELNPARRTHGADQAFSGRRGLDKPRHTARATSAVSTRELLCENGDHRSVGRSSQTLAARRTRQRESASVCAAST